MIFPAEKNFRTINVINSFNNYGLHLPTLELATHLLKGQWQISLRALQKSNMHQNSKEARENVTGKILLCCLITHQSMVTPL